MTRVKHALLVTIDTRHVMTHSLDASPVNVTVTRTPVTSSRENVNVNINPQEITVTDAYLVTMETRAVVTTTTAGSAPVRSMVTAQ